MSARRPRIRIARALPCVLGNRISLRAHLADAHHDLRLAAAAPTFTHVGTSAFALDDVLHTQRILAFERERVGDAETLHPEARKRGSVDFLNPPLDE